MTVTSTALFVISFAIVMLTALLLGLFIRNRFINSICAIVLIVAALGTSAFAIMYIWEVFG